MRNLRLLSALFATMVAAIGASTVAADDGYPRLLVIEKPGQQPTWRSIDNLFEAVDPDKPDPGGAVLFEDRFAELDVESSSEPPTGARYVDGWVAWNVRHLEANGDQAYKILIDGETHEIVEDGLALRGLERQTQAGLKYTAGMISTERSFALVPGTRIDVELKISRLSPGGHFTLWLLTASSPAWPPEIDFLEVVGSNLTFPNGPVDLLAFNAIGSPGGPSITFRDHGRAFWQEFHTFSFVYGEDVFRWLVDGVEVRSQTAFLTVPLYFLATWELGASGNKDFPGPINKATKWPFEAIIRSVKVTTTNGAPG